MLPGVPVVLMGLAMAVYKRRRVAADPRFCDGDAKFSIVCTGEVVVGVGVLMIVLRLT